VSLAEGRQIFDGLVEYPLPAKAGVKDYVFYCGDLQGFGLGAKKLFDKHWPAHVPKTATTLQDVMSALQTEVTTGGVDQIRELVLVAHANVNQLFLPVVAAGPGVDAAYGCVSAWSLAKLQNDIEGKFSAFDLARKAVVAHLLDDSWVTIRACNFGNSAEALYALYSFFGGRANVYAPTKFMVFGDWAIKPGYRIESKFGVYDYLVKQHFLSSNEHTPKRQAAIVTDLVDPESFAEPFQLATAQMTGGDLGQAAAYQQLVSGLDQYSVTSELRAAFAAAGHPLSAGAQVVSANATAIDPQTAPPGRNAVWYVGDTSFPDGAETIDLVYQVRDETDGGGMSTLTASAQLAVDSAYASIPVQLFFDNRDDDAFWGVLAKLAGYADVGPYADPKYKDAYDAIQTLLNDGTWTDGTNDIAKPVNDGLRNAGYDELPDPLPPIQLAPNPSKWLIPLTPVGLVALIGLEPARDGSALHAIVIGLDLDKDALQDQQKGVIQDRGRVPHTPGTEIAAYLDRFTADQLASFIDYLRSAYRPAYAYYVAHAMAAIERKRDFLTWETAQPDFTDPLPKYAMLRPNENADIGKVAFDFDFNDNWREVKQHSKYTATVNTDLFKEESLTDKLHLSVPYICGTLPPDSVYFSRDELKAVQSQGFESYFAASAAKTVFDLPTAPVDQGCIELEAVLQKWKEMQDANESPDVQQKTLEDMVGSDHVSGWERLKRTLEPFHMGTELWDITGKPHIEYRVVLTEYLERKFEHVWLGHAFEAAGWILEVYSTIKVPFDLWMEGMEAQEEGAQLWDARGQVVAIRQWCLELMNLTVRVAPFPTELHIDIGGEDQAVDRWVAEQQAEHPLFNILTVPTEFATELNAGYARAAVSFGRIGPQIVEQADKFITQQIAESGLSPCSIDALTKVGLFDLDSLRRKVIWNFAQAVRDSMPPL
jgi:hypothetical protein